METHEAFLDELAHALRQLHAPDALGATPLAHLLASGSTSTRAATVARLLTEGIEQLRPATLMDLNDQAWRAYTILHDRYQLRSSSSQLEKRLNLGDRQVRREHKRALTLLAALLEPHIPGSAQASPIVVVRDAVYRMTPAPSLFGLQGLFDDVRSVAQRVTGQHAAPHWVVTPVNQTVFSDRGILSQLLLKLILRHHPAHTHTAPSGARARLHEGKVEVMISGVDSADSGFDAALVRMLAETLGVTLTLAPERGVALFELPAGGMLHTVLLVDDEPISVELLRTMLTGTEFDLKFETAPEMAVQSALALRPEVIVLDVMMPAMDGWTLLQRLRALPQLQQTPILVYSVLEESALAEALGATRFLRKPVSRTQWLSVLRELIR